jgi:hypothetical protein
MDKTDFNSFMEELSDAYSGVGLILTATLKDKNKVTAVVATFESVTDILWTNSYTFTEAVSLAKIYKAADYLHAYVRCRDEQNGE